MITADCGLRSELHTCWGVLDLIASVPMPISAQLCANVVRPCYQFGRRTKCVRIIRDPHTLLGHVSRDREDIFGRRCRPKHCHNRRMEQSTIHAHTQTDQLTQRLLNHQAAIELDVLRHRIVGQLVQRLVAEQVQHFDDIGFARSDVTRREIDFVRKVFANGG